MREFFVSLLLAASLQAASVRFDKQPGQVTVLVEGTPVTSLHYGDKWDKPFLHPLRTASGAVVSRGWPVDPQPGDTSDHIWHRGLWFAHGDINGDDYWRELGKEKTSRLVVKEAPVAKGDSLTIECAMINTGGKNSGTIVQTFRFGVDAKTRYIDVTAVIRANQGVALKLGDTEEGALGLRFSDDFREDRGAILKNSEGGLGTKQIWGKRARWTDYSIQRDGKPVGVTLMDHPANPRFPTYWHARGYGLNAANPFGVRDFTKDKTQDGSLTIDPGEEVTFRYRVALHEGVDPEQLWLSWAPK